MIDLDRYFGAVPHVLAVRRCLPRAKVTLPEANQVVSPVTHSRLQPNLIGRDKGRRSPIVVRQNSCFAAVVGDLRRGVGTVAFLKLRAIVLAVSLMSAFVGATAAGAAAATLLGATTLVGLGANCSFSAVFILGSGLCPSLKEGGSASSDVTAFGTRQVMEATAGPIGPVASVEGDMFPVGPPRLFLSGSAEARVDYEVEVGATSAVAFGVSRVPVIFSADVEANVIGGGSGFAFAQADSPVGAIRACSPGDLEFPGGVPCVTSPTNAVSGSVPPNTPLSMSVFAVASFGSNPGGFFAAADPLLAIANELIPGTDVNFREAFTVLVSPGVTQSVPTGPAGGPPPPSPGGGSTTSVPEPASPFLFGSVLLGFAAMRRIRSKRKIEPNGGPRRCASRPDARMLLQERGRHGQKNRFRLLDPRSRGRRHPAA